MKRNRWVYVGVVLSCLLILPLYTHSESIVTKFIYPAPLTATGGSGGNNTASQSERTVQKNLEEVKAGFIKNFAISCNWPDEDRAIINSKNFIIGTFEKNDVINYLNKRKSDITIKSKLIKIIVISDYSEIKNCHLLYITPQDEEKLTKILEAVDSLPILTISDTEGYEEKGIMINIKIETINEKKQPRFIVNRTMALKNGLKLGSRMLQSASKVF